MDSTFRVINWKLTGDFRGCTLQQSAQIRRRGEFASGVRITGTQQGNGLETAGQPIPVCQMSIRRDVSHIRGKRRLQQTSTPSWRHTCHHTGSVILVHKSWAQDRSLFLSEVSSPQFWIFFIRFMRVNAGYGNTIHHSIRFRCTGDEPSRKHIFYAMKASFFPCRVIVSALFSSRGGAQLIGKRLLVLVLARWHYQARVDQCQQHVRTQYEKSFSRARQSTKSRQRQARTRPAPGAPSQ